MSKTETVFFEKPATGIFSEDTPCEKAVIKAAHMPINGYKGYIVPGDDAAALAAGDRLKEDIVRGKLADFERDEAFCKKNGQENPDRMVHVSTFEKIDGCIYMTYYANTGTTEERADQQEARLAFCPESDPADMTVVTVQKVGDTLDGKTVTGVYDTILFYVGGDKLYIAWTAAVEGKYYRLYRTFSLSRREMSAIRPNRLRVGDVVNDFSATGIVFAFAANGIPVKQMFSDIGIMQKLSMRVENGEKWYYTGMYSGFLNAVIKSRDLVEWTFVAAPDFLNLSKWENAVYVLDDKVYYFVRQDDDCKQGFLTYYDLKTEKWATPCLIRDAQSRSDFIVYDGKLYLIHAPLDRDGFGIVRVDRDDLADSRPVAVVRMGESLFYPFARVIGDTVYLSYTVDRKHIRLTRFDAKTYLK